MTRTRTDLPPAPVRVREATRPADAGSSDVHKADVADGYESTDPGRRRASLRSREPPMPSAAHKPVDVYELPPTDASVKKTEPSQRSIDTMKATYPALGKVREEPALTEAYKMLARAYESGADIGGMPAFQVLHDSIIGNPDVTDGMILQMRDVQLSQIAQPEPERSEVDAKHPGIRETPAHKMAVALLSAATGLPAELVSHWCPGLGVMGTTKVDLGEPVFLRDQLNNALHDTTDYLKDAGVDGLNNAVWGAESSWMSAVISLFS